MNWSKEQNWPNQDLSIVANTGNDPDMNMVNINKASKKTGQDFTEMWHLIIWPSLSQRSPASNKLLCGNPICKQMKRVTHCSRRDETQDGETRWIMWSHASLPCSPGEALDEPPCNVKTMLTPRPQMNKPIWEVRSPSSLTIPLPSQRCTHAGGLLKYKRVVFGWRIYKEVRGPLHLPGQPQVGSQPGHRLGLAWHWGFVRPEWLGR